MRALCDTYQAWLHIDAGAPLHSIASGRTADVKIAFGAFARVVPELRHLAAHLELADSIASDGKVRAYWSDVR